MGMEPIVEGIDVLAIAAHRDDVEQTCGGTLLKMAQKGYRTGILDLTRGEMGTRGSAQEREREATEAARILKISWRGALDIPDGRVENTWENRIKVARALRLLRPRVVILPYWDGRHPDHYTASTLGYEACFQAGLSRLEITPDFESCAVQVSAFNPPAVPAGSTNLTPHRPFKILYATLYFDVRPTFVVDISDQFEARFQSLLAYKTQFSDQASGQGLFPATAEIRARIESMARFYGALGGVDFAEPFLQKEVGLVDDLLILPVKSI
jgi:N-acetylglucosamine malate deacetylase 1